MPEVYDRCLGPALFHPFAVEVARRAARLASREVLELAAGTGVATRELVAALPGAAVTATDLNRAMVVWGARAVPQAHWAVADAQRPPFADGRFDLVACQFGVMFFPDRPAAFAQARRVLAPGGRLLFTTWDAVERHGFDRAVMAGVRHAFPLDPPLFLVNVPHGYHDVDRVVADVRAGGFTDVEVDTVTLTGHARSATDIAVGFCTGSPLRAGIESRADLRTATALVEEVVTAELGTGPVTAEMTAYVVEARRS
jgi:SAM-dependent methyltransferase